MNLILVERAGLKGSVDEPARADELVVAVGLGETVAALTGAVPVLGRIEDDDLWQLLVAPAEPSAEQRRFTPAAATGARLVGFARVAQGRVSGRDAAVDDADDDAIAVQAFDAAQAAVGIEQAQECRAVARRHRPHFVFPDCRDFRQVLELLGLRRTHAGGETVDAEAIAVDLARPWPGFGQDAALFFVQPRHVCLDVRAAAVELHAGGDGNFCLLFCDRRRAELDDVDLGLPGLVTAGQLHRYVACIDQHRFCRGGGGNGEQAAEQDQAGDQHGVSRSGSRATLPGNSPRRGRRQSGLRN